MAERLNWGCGPVVAEGWANSDMLTWPAMRVRWRGNAEPPFDLWAGLTDHVGPIQEGLPWADETFDFCVSHHALQMLPEPDLVPALAELRRVTKPWGYLRVSVPNATGAWRAWERGDMGWFPLDAPTISDALCVYLTQGGATRSIFTTVRLMRLLRCAGWGGVTVGAHGSSACPDKGILELDSRPRESIYVEAQR